MTKLVPTRSAHWSGSGEPEPGQFELGGRNMLRRLRIVMLSGALLAVLPAATQAAVLKPHGAPNHKIGHSTSTNWSGYAVSGAGPYKSVSAHWTQPTVNCTKTPTAYSSF